MNRETDCRASGYGRDLATESSNTEGLEMEAGKWTEENYENDS